MTTGDRYCGCGSGLMVWQCPCKSGGTTKQWGDIRIQDPKMEEMLELITALKAENERLTEVNAKQNSMIMYELVPLREFSRNQTEQIVPMEEKITSLRVAVGRLKTLAGENLSTEEFNSLSRDERIDITFTKDTQAEEIAALKAENDRLKNGLLESMNREGSCPPFIGYETACPTGYKPDRVLQDGVEKGNCDECRKDSLND